ncbi:MAG: phosphatidic acid phosphatase, partial [Bacteroidetes bacterium]|nr:phosphatidic acid phosphatase [Bacteroidota bacterium]
QYNLIRPESFIKKYIDAGFSTVIGTPAFPSYSSGHAYESGAASMVFINMFADANGNYDFTDDSQLQYGYAARHYSNFNDMAQECANSRFYGGIHYNEDNQEGLKMGREIGDNVNKLLQWPSNIK